ncbi:hypothetical protein OUZ56_022078 [Daphnia magna]|uniref:Uncharacterized protein n=1 Tax=Daphnia magna TaxID=35525 RepID=A0ABR0AVC7_9CRUS|nr:hypothetical protein OUZ56_022078 [Daphnia magna]
MKRGEEEEEEIIARRNMKPDFGAARPWPNHQQKFSNEISLQPVLHLIPFWCISNPRAPGGKLFSPDELGQKC